jgi:2-amino-4-hydroxy-6-hydroxymethyldihydropteridine diphosphokinase
MRDSHDGPWKMLPPKHIFVSLGANTTGCWGAPYDTLCRSLNELERCGINIVCCSSVYRTNPHAAAGMMHPFYNTVIGIRSHYAIGSLLRVLKNIERRAGRRLSARWSRRPLDLDIVDFGGRVLNWPSLTRRLGPIVLPHPLMQERGFVLVPLAEIAPKWRHPVLGLSAESLLKANPRLRRGVVLTNQTQHQFRSSEGC